MFFSQTLCFREMASQSFSIVYRISVYRLIDIKLAKFVRTKIQARIIGSLFQFLCHDRDNTTVTDLRFPSILQKPSRDTEH